MKQPLVLAWLIGFSACTIHVDDDHKRSGRFGDAKWADSEWSSGGECRDHDDCSNDCYCAQGQCSELPFCRHHRECPDDAFCSHRLGRCVIDDDATGSSTSGGNGSSDEGTETEGESSGDPDRETTGDTTTSDAPGDAASGETSTSESSSSPGRGDSGAPAPDGGLVESPADAGPAEPSPPGSSWPADAAASCSTVDGSSDCWDRPAVCFSSDDCEDGLCVNAQCRWFCEASSDCRVDEACVLGLCRPVDALECTVKDDCPESDDCVGGRCVRRCLSDTDCAQCDDGPMCRNGYCGPE